jgi:hypothetical protein
LQALRGITRIAENPDTRAQIDRTIARLLDAASSMPRARYHRHARHDKVMPK